MNVADVARKIGPHKFLVRPMNICFDVRRHASKKRKRKPNFHDDGSILIDIRISIWPHVFSIVKRDFF